MRIDLNADLGEHDSLEASRLDDALCATVTSVNIACGFHAGTPDVMRRVLARAREVGTAAGAHPGYKDAAGFGRTVQAVSMRVVENLVAYQVGALAALAQLEGVALAHVKPHGALYNEAARDPATARAIAAAVRHVDASLRLFALAGSHLVRAAEDAGLRAVAEGFADRGYRADGSLVPRDEPGALVTDPAAAAERGIALARDGVILAVDGRPIALTVESICVHSDTPGALAIARALRDSLEAAGITVTAPAR
jgi:5-oxoprolinase (ATP-hydrolysing) subunit A